ncbi:MAG: YqeG family HAD IIIA-type phosphatase, partial [Clostridiales bacterium]|nr:YqeG family HAD IIIA-type phosphatase [Clostridiales bacterium]
SMKEYLPHHHFHRVTDITPDMLRGMGASAVGVDADNTIIIDSSYHRFIPGALEWIESLKAAGIPVILVSNTNTYRAKCISKQIGTDYIAYSKKPKPDAVFEAARRLGTDVGSFAMIGDQLFADVTAANRAGAISVLVDFYQKEAWTYIYYAPRRRREARVLAEIQGGLPYDG